MASNPRVAKAFIAMRAIGIPAETVKPVLKNLLKLYDRNWELIEEESYRALADAIFEYQEDKVVENKKRDASMLDGSEPPFKKLHVAQQEDQVSSTIDNGSTMLVLEEGEIPPTSGQEITESPCPRNRIIESSSCLPHARFIDKGKGTVSSQVAPARKSTSKRASCAVYLKRPMDEPGFLHMQREKMLSNHSYKDLIKPKTEQSINDSLPFAVPTLMVHSALPGSLEGSSTGNKSIKYLLSQNVDTDNKDDGSACNYGTSCEASFDIASSPMGEVKISLNCYSAIGLPNFHIPNLDAVLKFVEDKYRRSYNTDGAQFSVMNLLKEFCESYLELGIYSTNKSVITNSSAEVIINVPGGHRITGPITAALRIGNYEKDSDKKESSCSGSSNSRSLVVVQQQPISKRAPHNISDVTKGAEKVKISLVDEIGNEHLPNFFYIPQNMIYQNAYVHFSLARISDEDCCSSCLDDCLASSIPCACARETGGEFAYTPQGLLKEEFLKACISMNREPQKHYRLFCQENQDCPVERFKNENMPEPCKGHIVRKFIKECWRKCGCNLQCGNRVVQRGIACNLQVFLADEGKGWGLRTLEDLPKGAFVCEYVGEILTNTELYERNMRSTGNERHTYPVLLDADWGSEEVLKDEEALCLDATFYGNVARFINHRCFDANLFDIPVEVETPDHHYYHLAFFTTRKVDALEELTWDYGIDFEDHNHPIKAFNCCCGSASCRDINQKGARFSGTGTRSSAITFR